MLCVVDCLADRVWLAIPQATEWQRIGNSTPRNPRTSAPDSAWQALDQFAQAKIQAKPKRGVLGDHRRQSEQSRLELALRLSHRLQRANRCQEASVPPTSFAPARSR